MKEFCLKHNKKGECRIETSPFLNGAYHKNYMYSDGATFTEINEYVYETITFVKHGIKFETEIQFFRTEYWSTDDSKSKFVYEKV